MNTTQLKFILISMGIVLVFGLYCCSSPPEEQTDNAASAVKAREIAFAKTMADRDFDTFITFISPEGIFFSGNKPLRGHDAISHAWAPYFESETAPFSWHPDVVEVLASGHLALSSGPVYDPSGKRVATFHSVWRLNDDGQLKIVFDKGSAHCD